MSWTSKRILPIKTIISRRCRMKFKRKKKPLLIKRIVTMLSNIKSILCCDRSTTSLWSAFTSTSLSTSWICKNSKSVSRHTRKTTCTAVRCASFLEAGGEYHISGSSKELTKKQLTMKRPKETKSLPSGIKRLTPLKYTWLNSKRRFALRFKRERNLPRLMKCP